MNAYKGSGYFESTSVFASFSKPPANAVLAQRISKLAVFAKRNGPNFVELIMSKQKDNPDYSFLFGGEGSEYYKWLMFCNLHDLPPDKNPEGDAVTKRLLEISRSNNLQPPVSQAGGISQSHPGTLIKQGYMQSSSLMENEEQNFERQKSTDLENHPIIDQGSEAATLTEGLSLPPDVASGFANVLLMLNGYKESIKASQHWFMSYLPLCEGMAMMMHRRVMQLSDYIKQLHIIYLINDILFKSLSQRQPGQIDIVASVFYPLLGPMLARTFATAGKTEDIKERLLKILSFWGEREVYDSATLSAFQQIMFTRNINIIQQMQHNATLMHQAVSQNFTLPLWQQQNSNSSLNPTSNPQMAGKWQSSQIHVFQQQPNVVVFPAQEYPTSLSDQELFAIPKPATSQDIWTAQNSAPSISEPVQISQTVPLPLQLTAKSIPKVAFDPPPQSRKPGEQLVNPMSFPPGLIPRLVRDKAKFTFSYSPLSPLDIEKAGLPPPPNRDDPYLKSRIEKYYTEIEEYRPGAVREYVELKRGTGRASEEESQQKRQRKRRTGFDMVEDSETGMFPDGSFAGLYGKGYASSSAYAGLGANPVPKKNLEDDVYQNYRRLRSDVYHNTIPRGLSSICKDA